MKSTEDQEYFASDHVTIIQPHGNAFDLKLKELWRYRDLILLFVPWSNWFSAWRIRNSAMNVLPLEVGKLTTTDR